MSFLKVANILNPNQANASIIINTVGNVGIGSSSPAVALDVTGSTNISGNLNVLGTATLLNPSITGNVSTTGNVTVGGNLQLNGSFFNVAATGARITGDFTNSTQANKVAFQSSTANGATVVTAIPNGSSTIAQWRAYNGADPDNSAYVGIIANGLSQAQIISGITGTGSYLPMTFLTGGSERMRLATAGNLLINGTTAPLGGNAVVVVNNIGTNAGGTQWSGGTAGGGNVYGVNGGGLVFGSYTGAVGSETYTERLRITNSGNISTSSNILVGNVTGPYSVGISRAYLTVQGFGAGASTGAGVIQLATTAAGSTNPYPIGNIEWHIPDNTSSSSTRVAFITVGGYGATANNVGSYMQFATKVDGVSGSANPGMILNGLGNVFIGLNANPPSSPLTGNATVIVQGLGTNGGGMQLSGGASGGGNVYAINGGGLVFGSYTGAVGSETYTERMRLTGSSLSIGTPTIASSATTAVTINSGGGGGIQYTAANNGGGNVQALGGGGLQWGTFTGGVGAETYSAKLNLSQPGALSSYYPSVSSGLSTFNVTQGIIGALHLTTIAGANATSKAQTGITFGYNYQLTNAQAGIYVTNNNVDGMAMALATTNNYGTGPITAMTLAETGLVTVTRGALNITNQPAWHAYYSGAANQAITNGSTTFTPNTTLVNTGGSYSTGTGRFTAAVAGVYRVYAGVGYVALSGVTYAGVGITKNGATIVDGYNGQTGYSTPFVEATVSLAVGDYIQFFAGYSVGSGSIELSAGTRTYFGGSLIG